MTKYTKWKMREKSGTFHVCFVYIVSFYRSPVFLLFLTLLLGRCLLADQTVNHHSDVMTLCQSADVPVVFEA